MILNSVPINNTLSLACVNRLLSLSGGCNCTVLCISLLLLNQSLEQDMRPGEVYCLCIIACICVHGPHGLSTYASCVLRVKSTSLIRCSSSRARYCRENYGQDLASWDTEFDFSAALCADRLSDFLFCDG